jgi:lipoate-protein ligase A
MAIDQSLLQASLMTPAGAPSLRLYRWSRPTLSLGHHQRALPPHWLELAANGTIDLVRRPSGGRAVLHGGDITYALVWPAPPPQRSRAYGLACGWLCRAFAELGHPLHFGRRAPSRERASCFATSTAADLVHRDGAKRIGSAQLWSRGTLLQHGSIQIAPAGDLWRILFGEDPPQLVPLPLVGSELEAHLRRCAERHLDLGWAERGQGGCRPNHWIEQPLQPCEWEAVRSGLDRYRLPAETSVPLRP